MAALLKKLLIGTSVAVGMSAIASVPVQAAAFDFDNSETNYATYTHDSNNLWIKGNEAAAIKALSDGNLQTNVELNYKDELNSSSVGFTATAGKYTAKVSSVTATEFNTFQGEWLNGLLNAYQPLKSVWNNLASPFQDLALGAFKSVVGFGDPNIAEFSLDKTGAMSMKTMGFYDLKPKVNTLISGYSDTINLPLAQANTALADINGKITTVQGKINTLNANIQLVQANSSYKTAIAKLAINPNAPLTTAEKIEVNKFIASSDLLSKAQSGLSQLQAKKVDVTSAIATLTAAQQQVDSFTNALNQIQHLQISEITKVELNGNTEFVYSFKAENSGFVAKDDGQSYSGVYSWSQAGTPAAVPEPSTMLGLMAVGGLFGLAKRNSGKKA